VQGMSPAERDAIWDEHLRLRSALFHEHPLEYLFFEVTRACNLSCAYCGSSCSQKLQRPELPVSKFIEIAKQLATDFDPKQFVIAITGGEPLTKPGILDLFRGLQDVGIAFGMVTNGWLLTDEVARTIVDTGLFSITLSMDAPPPLNDQLRGEGTTLAVFKAIEALQRAGYAGRLEIFSTITKPAVPLLEQTRALVSSMRVPYWRVSPVMPIGRAARRPDLILGANEVRQLYEFVLAARTDGYTPMPETCEEGYLGNRFEGNVRPYLCQCPAGVTVAGISCDGRIGACPELSDAFVQGHIETDRFRDVWENRYQVFRDRRWMRKGQCGNCEHFRRCEGGSVHLYENTESAPHRCLYELARAGEG
jgi:radical SAM protein with 4Fe4S-binding SPASM domain